MKKLVLALTASAVALTAGVASAQPYGGYDRGYDRGYHSDHRDYDRGHRDHDRYDRRDGRYDGHRYRMYGGHYGYTGYRGHWREGQRYPYYRDSRYVISDYRAYGLPAPRYGYRYYRDDSGDVVMATIAGGVIGLIAGQALNDGY